MHIDWDNTVVTGISGIKIEMPTEANISIFNLHVVPAPPPRYDYYDDPHAHVTDQPIPSTSIGATALAPPFSFTV